MNTQELNALASGGESEILEFKKSTAQLQSVMRTACAFLNGKGGIILIGVLDNGRLVGQTVSDKTRKEISVELNKIDSYLDLNISFVPITEERVVIVVTVPGGVKAPYTYDGRAFVRNQSTTVRMPQEQYEQLLYNRKSEAGGWENIVSRGCGFDDLDQERIQQVIRLAIAEGRITEFAAQSSLKEILTKLKLLIDDRLNHAAVILFCKNEEKQFMQSCLRLARFRGIDKQEFIDNKTIQGNAFDLYEKSLEFLQSYLPLSGKIDDKTLLRVEELAVPLKVLREAMVNALCHRDYSSNSGAIYVAIYDDRVEITSSGRLPHNIHLEDLTRVHSSHPRNPLICNAFYVCKKIEKWGRGTQDMVVFCDEAGNPKPEFIELAGSFTVIFRLKELIGTNVRQREFVLTQRQENILNFLENQQPCTTSKIVDFMQDFASRRAIQMDLKSLEIERLIRREGLNRATIWRLSK